MSFERKIDRILNDIDSAGGIEAYADSIKQDTKIRAGTILQLIEEPLEELEFQLIWSDYGSSIRAVYSNGQDKISEAETFVIMESALETLKTLGVNVSHYEMSNHPATGVIPPTRSIEIFIPFLQS